MKIIYSNPKKGTYKLQVETLEDLWYLNDILAPNDTVKARTLRKIKKENIDQRATKATKKPITLKILIEKIEFSKYSNSLRLLGTIVEGPEDIPLGSHHTIAVEENTILTIIKEKWYKYQAEKLKEAALERIPNILICVLDREEAYFAMLKKYGYQLLSSIKGQVQKKENPENIKSDFYKQVADKLSYYTEKNGIDKIILASPAFFKEDALQEIKDKNLRNKVILATCSAVGKNGINEVLKRDETKKALKEARAVKEIDYVENLLTEISKNGLATYGIRETKKAVEAGAVSVLLVTDSLIRKMRIEENFNQLDELMKTTESIKGEVHLISGDHEGGKKLDGLGGIGSLLRYKLNY
jgi:protein pelota